MRCLRFAGILALSGLLVLVSACTRSDMAVPLPSGPSTIALIFDLEAVPNVIMATDSRPTATIKATVWNNGLVVSGQTVFFTITSGPGEFSDYSTRIAVQTDSTGVAAVTFIGPTMYEMSGDTNATIKAQVQTTSPNYLYKTIDVRILKGSV